MENVIKLSKPAQTIIGFLFVITLSLLSSCTKNAADIPTPTEAELTSSNQSGQSANENTIHAVPFEANLFVSCANGGAGETVEFSGFTNFIYQLAWTDHGFTLVYHDNTHKVKGVGVLSGETFVVSGGTNGTVMGSWVNSQWIGTTIRQLRVTGQNTNFTITYKYHITVISDGTVIVKSIEQTADCNN